MSLDELINAGRVHPFKATPQEINKAMDIARRDLALAEKSSQKIWTGAFP